MQRRPGLSQRLLLLALACVIRVPDTDADLRYDHLSVDQGLSNQVVTCVYQDREGFLWFGTQDGLNRYDGAGFRVYRHDPLDPTSLSDSYVRAILQTDDGSLWVGTDGGGLNVRLPGSEGFSSFRHDSDDPESLGHDEVMALAEGNNGELWLGTMGGGLDLLDPETGRCRHFRHDPEDPKSLSHDIARVLLVDSDGDLWVGTRGGGLNRFDAEHGSFTAYRHDESDPTSLNSDDVMALFEDNAGTLWVGTFGGGLNALDRRTGRCRHYHEDPLSPSDLSNDRVWALREDELGRIWVCTNGGGVDLLSPEGNGVYSISRRFRSDPADDESLASDYARAIHQDLSGAIWIGTESGISKTHLRREVFRHYHHDPGDPGSLSSDSVWAFEEDRHGDLWIGTEAGLNRLDAATGRIDHFRNDPGDPGSLGHDEVWTILEDSSGTLWVGTYGGLNSLEPGSSRFRTYVHDPGDPSSLSNNEVWALLEDRQGTLWVGTYSGLNRLDRTTGRFTRFHHHLQDPGSLSDDGIFALHEDSSGTLWVGTYRGGLNRFSRETGSFSSFRHDPGNPDSLSHDRVRVLYENLDGELWVGTSAGLDLFHEDTQTFVHYSTASALAGRAVEGILADDKGFLWIGTSNGLHRLDPRNGDSWRFDENDGLQGNEIHQGAFLRRANGELLFGGDGGFNAFDPEGIEPSRFVPPIVLTSFRVFDRDRKALTVGSRRSGALEISFRENFFSFEFAALDYVAPDRIRYAYRMEGFDKDWVQCGSRRYASYTNLDPGRYEFRVKASNSDGVWCENGLRIAVTITPPFWKTLWFRSFAMLMVAATAFTAYRLRIRNLEERQRQLSRKLDDRTRHLKQSNEQKDKALDELRRTKDEVERLARTDALTGLWNRRALQERLEGERLRSDRSGRPFAVIMGDIDNFKRFNDRWGHLLGDAVLVHVSSLIQGAVRQVDTVGRWGGEEVVFLLPGTNLQGGVTTADMLRKTIESNPLEENGEFFEIHMTFGVTAYDPPMTADQCIQIADEAMLEGKTRGKNCVVSKSFRRTASLDE